MSAPSYLQKYILTPGERVYQRGGLTKSKFVLKTWLTEEKTQYGHPARVRSYSRQLVRQNNSQKNKEVLVCEALLEMRSFWEKRTGFEKIPQSKRKFLKNPNNFRRILRIKCLYLGQH